MALPWRQTENRASLVAIGVIAIIFGLVVLIWPSITVRALLAMFGVFAFAAAAVWLIGAIVAGIQHRRWWNLLMQGLISLAIGILVFAFPVITGVFLLSLIAIWAILTGAFQLFRGLHAGSTFLSIAGAISLIFGIVLFVSVFGSFAGAVLIVGFYALIYGILLLGEAIVSPARSGAA